MWNRKRKVFLINRATSHRNTNIQIKLKFSYCQVHALETAAIKPDPFNQYVAAGVVSGIATVSIGKS